MRKAAAVTDALTFVPGGLIARRKTDGREVRGHRCCLDVGGPGD
jgi:hypothetical protein